MLIKAVIIEFNEFIEEEILILANDSFILDTFYLGSSINLLPLCKNIEYSAEISIIRLNDVEIEEIIEEKKDIVWDGKTFQHYIYGQLDVDKLIIKSIIDVPIEKEDIFNYSYCDQKYIKMKIDRFDIEFLSHYKKNNDEF